MDSINIYNSESPVSRFRGNNDMKPKIDVIPSGHLSTHA